MPKPIALDTPCEVCGKNEWWDNTTTKKSPKHPDYKCANKECKGKDGYPGSRWKPKPKDQPQGGRLTPDDTTPDERGERVFTWAAYTYTYSKLLGAVVSAFKAHDVPVDSSAVQAAVATLLIQGDRTHIPLMVPRPAKPEPKPAPKKMEREDVFDDFEGVDSELPF